MKRLVKTNEKNYFNHFNYDSTEQSKRKGLPTVYFIPQLRHNYKIFQKCIPKLLLNLMSIKYSRDQHETQLTLFVLSLI